MSFKLDDLVIDRIQMGFAEKTDGTPLYTLTQLSDGKIDITADSKDATDAQGTLIKKFYQGKKGTFAANNAMINLNILGAASGSAKEVGTSSAKITMPKIITVKAGKTVTLEGLVDGTLKVNALAANGTMGGAFVKEAAASATGYAITSGGEFTAPTTDSGETQFVVRYDRATANAVAIKNKADKFPGTIKLTLKALCVDPCSPDTLTACYIVLPSFQVSPEVSIDLTTEGKLEYKGDLQVGYCNDEKTLYEVYVCSDDEEE